MAGSVANQVLPWAGAGVLIAGLSVGMLVGATIAMSDYVEQSARHSTGNTALSLDGRKQTGQSVGSMHSRVEVASQRLAGRCMR
jgi:hypothetical protein